MPNYIVHSNGRTAFPDLTMVEDGIAHTLEADDGDIVRLHESTPEDSIKHFIEQGALEATSKAVTSKPVAAPAEPDPKIVAAVKAAVAEQAEKPAE